MATEERMPAIPADKMTADQKKAADGVRGRPRPARAVRLL